jgi:hypothetical protein
MQRIAYHPDELDELDELDEADELTRDELGNDRLPGMPLLGFVTGALLSLVIWGALAFVALNV